MRWSDFDGELAEWFPVLLSVALLCTVERIEPHALLGVDSRGLSAAGRC